MNWTLDLHAVGTFAPDSSSVVAGCLTRSRRPEERWLVAARPSAERRTSIRPFAEASWAWAVRAVLRRTALLFPGPDTARITVRMADRGTLIRVGKEDVPTWSHATFLHTIAHDATRDLHSTSRAVFLIPNARFRPRAPLPAELEAARACATWLGDRLADPVSPTLADLEADVVAQLAYRTRWSLPGGRRVSTLAADGLWEDVLTRRLAGKPAESPVGSSWADEQCFEWLEVLS